MEEHSDSVAVNATKTYPPPRLNTPNNIAYTNLTQFKLKRNPQKLKWTKSFRKLRGKALTVDTTLLFGSRRNVPVRYNRELVQKTLTAMERVSLIRERRERVFYKRRMEANKEREKANDRKLVEENAHLLPRMRGSERKALEEAGEVVVEDELAVKVTSKVFGKQNMGRMKVLVDGGVEEGDDMDMD